MDELKIGYTTDAVNSTSSALAKLAFNFYKPEQKIGSFYFYHALTMMKGGTSIAQSHWPEQSLAWFAPQFAAGTLNPYDKKVIKTQSDSDTGLLAIDDDTVVLADNEHLVVYYDPIDGEYYDAGIIEDDDYIASIALSDELSDEGYDVINWRRGEGRSRLEQRRQSLGCTQELRGSGLPSL